MYTHNVGFLQYDMHSPVLAIQPCISSYTLDPKPFPEGPTYTTIMELGPKRPSQLWFLGPNSIIVVYMDPLGLWSL